MKTKYKIIIACIITCVVTAFTTVYVMNRGIASVLLNSDKIMCKDGVPPDEHGCCPGETYTDMDDLGWNCCPDSGGDCFPPIEN